MLLRINLLGYSGKSLTMRSIILRKEVLAPGVFLLTIAAEEIAKKAKAGQFAVLRVDEKGERFPLTLADFDAKAGVIQVVFQEVGTSTSSLPSWAKVMRF